MKPILTFFLLLSFLSSSTIIYGQWTKVTSFNQVINDMLDVNNTLFVIGSFTERNGVTSFRSTRYNGSTFTDNTATFGGTGLREMAIFEGNVWAVGGQGVYIWNGTSWNNSPSSSISSIFADGDTLYIGDDMGSVTRRISGGGVIDLPELEGFSQIISSLTVYNGDLIAGGSFENFDTVTLNRMARWDGNTWRPLGSGLSGGGNGSHVRTMTVYNGELYVGGSFTGAGGQAIKNIAKWNGSEWSDVGGSNTGSGSNGIRDMVVHNGELYVAGDFSELGDRSARFVAKWNGNEWTALDLTETNQFPNAITIYKDQLYVGTFDFTDAGLYKRGLTTAVPETELPTTMIAYPNPADDFIYLDIPKDYKEVTAIVYNLYGQPFKELKLSSNRIHCAGWPGGVYFIELKTGGLPSGKIQKIIVE